MPTDLLDAIVTEIRKQSPGLTATDGEVRAAAESYLNTMPAWNIYVLAHREQLRAAR